MKRAPYYEPPKNCNNNNVREYEPYVDRDGKLIVDSEWWERVPVEIKSGLEPDKIEELVFPHPVKEPKTELCGLVYLKYIDAFDFHKWCECLDRPYRLYVIPSNIKELIVSANITGHINDEIKEWLPELPFKECFVRLSSTSGKNEKSVSKITTKKELLEYLCGGNSILLQREFCVKDKETFLIIQEWKNIEKRNEFRVFWKNGKITGASQQYWNTIFHYSQEELDLFEKAFNELSYPKVPYKDWIADVYWDGQKFELIECNPFGASTGAGSSLFNWIDDYDILYGEKQAEFRYLSIINI